jgi:hypothetical protein
MERTSGAVRRNDALNRYEIEVDGHLALAEFRVEDGVVAFTHTEAPAALQGRGAASKLIREALLDVRARGLKARADCSFVAAFLERHPEFDDLRP